MARRSDALEIGDASISVTIAPAAGGRLSQITVGGVDLLVARDPLGASALAWGSYPMAPWAGRIRRGRFEFRGRSYDLPRNLGPHAIHGVGFVSAWDVVHHDRAAVELRFPMPADARWPFGGTANQRIEVRDGVLRLELGVTATDRAFPASIGWHPWFRKPSRLDFRPTAMYRRDADHIAVDELVEVPPGPWDDCFVNDRPVELEIDGCPLRLTSDCTTWVVFDEPAHATCVEPQTAPPDAVNFDPHVLEPGDSLTAWYAIEPTG